MPSSTSFVQRFSAHLVTSYFDGISILCHCTTFTASCLLVLPVVQSAKGTLITDKTKRKKSQLLTKYFTDRVAFYQKCAQKQLSRTNDAHLADNEFACCLAVGSRLRTVVSFLRKYAPRARADVLLGPHLMRPLGPNDSLTW